MKSIVSPPLEVQLVLARFRLCARRRAAWLQQLWSEEGAPGGSAVVSHVELASILADRDAPEAEAAWLADQAAAREWDAELAQIEVVHAALENSRFMQIAHIFGLTPPDVDLLQACAAVAWDPALARVAAYLQDHAARLHLTEPLIARLYGHGRGGMWPSESALFRWELVRVREFAPAQTPALECDPQIRDWLRGQPSLDETLVGVARRRAAPPPLDAWPVEELTAWLGELLSGPQPAPARITVSGPRGSGRRSFSAAVAKLLQLPLLAMDADQISDADWGRVFLRAQRQAFLDTSALAWSGESLGRRAWPRHVPGFPLQFVVCEPGQEPAPVAELAERRVRLAAPDAAARAQLWRRHVPGVDGWEAGALTALAERHRTQPGDIADAARLGAKTLDQAARLVREAARGRLGALAQLLECPFGWRDLVLPPAVRQSLEAIAAEAGERAAFWEQPAAHRLFPQGQGLLALFTGPPGTGKTMAAQVIAAALGQDLFRVNLAQYVSKWVGETAKHCEFLISQAAEMDAILFFDEADAIFARRSAEMRDAQDRFANTDAAYLLQAIESYPGVALLATNLKANIDAAFIRRLRYIVEFPKLDAARQRALWRRLVLELAGRQARRRLGPVLDAIVMSLDATGAQVKYALLSALFISRREGTALSACHLLGGLERELAKEGRAIGPRDRDKILKAGAGESSRLSKPRLAA